ncbi:50S ribosomal subunit protein L4 [Hyella patelloides LEGE 07179]|uniref:Large ribosomal subunit protein uL4 n=1 Tax=Hyella patelloides LEGE 07179 TaxID=945734 RepID=A0A563VYC4_9CYAN|nr:50S ribosomal protein L4 [Hyella patelloides]VEP16454.1 50S ribosomal subunit protein L4 [Hyella patelloides LEGE 07179]
MVNCTVKNWQGEQVGEASLELTVAKEETASHIVHRALVRQMAMARQGTASSKTRSEVRGGGRKPWRQKGTGRARAGSSRSPLWRGGGVIFGPKPRDFSVKMNKKERRLALKTAFVARLEDSIVVENFAEQITKPKTKEVIAALERWGLDSTSKILLIVTDIPENLHLSTRNISNVKLLKAGNLNVYDLLNAKQIVVTTGALAKIQEVYGERV